jgi:hypothetical protein
MHGSAATCTLRSAAAAAPPPLRDHPTAPTAPILACRFLGILHSAGLTGAPGPPSAGNVRAVRTRDAALIVTSGCQMWTSTERPSVLAFTSSSSSAFALLSLLLLWWPEDAAAAGADPVLPPGCSGTFKGNYDDAVGSYGKGKRVLPVVTPCGGADNPNPKACAKCGPDGKSWSIMDPKIACPTQANACAGCPSKLTPQTCQASCAIFGSFRYAGVESGSQCFCGDKLPSKKADAKAKLVACKGDAKQMCGGSNIVGVYEITCIGPNDHGADSEAAEESTNAWGETVLIVFVAAVIGYVVIGASYNMKVGGRQGGSLINALPHRHFWSQLYGLVRDGVAFSSAVLGIKQATPGETLEFLPSSQSDGSAAAVPGTRRKKRRIAFLRSCTCP